MDWGFQELEAQAVAVRSYVLADLGGYGGYADTCDLTCQTYRGIEYETPTSVAAANDTAGEVMVMPDRPDRHHRVLGVDRRLHLERQPGVAVHRRARRRRRGVRARRLQPQPPVVDHGDLRRH